MTAEQMKYFRKGVEFALSFLPDEVEKPEINIPTVHIDDVWLNVVEPKELTKESFKAFCDNLAFEIRSLLSDVETDSYVKMPDFCPEMIKSKARCELLDIERGWKNVS